MKQSNKRRIFVKAENILYQIFSFDQHKDGSIYCGMPEFSEAQWMTVFKHNQEPKLIIAPPLQKDGKFSVHGSGMTTYRAHSEPKGHQLIAKGNWLLHGEKEKIGLRHLFTASPSKPKKNYSLSPRESDYIINMNELKPFVLIFIAIPGRKFTIDLKAHFHASDITVPPNVQWHYFGLRDHNIVWFMYSTKNMEKWPMNTQVCYYDGYWIPAFIGVDQNETEGRYRVELNKPAYEVNDDRLSISLVISK